ncbi:MAG: GerMN domain-containing protein [Firmicutes bacterium]|nr:GerMN domain-containing protein [Bacillota bacterium]
MRSRTASRTAAGLVTLISLITLFALIPTVRGCAPALRAWRKKQPTSQTVIHLATEDLKYLVPVTVELPKGDAMADAARLVIEWEGAGPLRSPFPPGSRFKSLKTDGSSAVVRVAVPPGVPGSESLPPGGAPLDRLAADALFWTLTGFDGVRHITVEGLGSPVSSPRPAFVNHDGSPPVEASMKVVLWFGYRGAYLVPVTRFVPRTLNPHKSAIEHLLAGPPRDGALEKTIPDGVKVLSVTLKSGVCTVDLSDELAKVRAEGEQAERMVIQSIALTLTEFIDVSSVELALAGKRGGTLGNYTASGRPLSRPVINPLPARPN